MTKKTFNGIEMEVYTMQDWERDHTLKVKVGQVIAPEVYWQLLNSVPPKCYGRGVFQPGEPDSWDWDKGCNLYQTYEHIGDNYWKFVGLKP